LDSVGKVRESEKLTVGESVEDGRLIDTVKGARLDLADAV
jgi:hypothetical protein